jgi:hypothetical protein
VKEKTPSEIALSLKRARQQEKEIMSEPESKGKHINSTMTPEEMSNTVVYAADSPETKAILAESEASKATLPHVIAEKAAKKASDDEWQRMMDEDNAHKIKAQIERDASIPDETGDEE